MPRIDRAVVHDEIGARLAEQFDEPGDGRSMPYGSTPRSKRADASERKPSRFIVRVIADRLEPGDLERDRGGGLG